MTLVCRTYFCGELQYRVEVLYFQFYLGSEHESGTENVIDAKTENRDKTILFH